MTGELWVIGLGPGAPELLTAEARRLLEAADVIFGYKTYLELIVGLAPGVLRPSSGMGQEVRRVGQAVECAAAGQKVALVSDGDPGIYGMAGLVYELLEARGLASLPVRVIPGVSALNAAAALLGAPLMNDFVVISLSDRLTPLDEICARLELAARADLVAVLYNPRGRQRVEPFRLACQVFSRHRPPATPVGIVRAAYRPDQSICLLTLAGLPQATVDMLSVVVIGSRRTRVWQGKLITPRGYQDKYDLTSEG